MHSDKSAESRNSCLRSSRLYTIMQTWSSRLCTSLDCWHLHYKYIVSNCQPPNETFRKQDRIGLPQKATNGKGPVPQPIRAASCIVLSSVWLWLALTASHYGMELGQFSMTSPIAHSAISDKSEPSSSCNGALTCWSSRPDTVMRGHTQKVLQRESPSFLPVSKASLFYHGKSTNANKGKEKKDCSTMC